jgi:hypothetical protein
MKLKKIFNDEKLSKNKYKDLFILILKKIFKKIIFSASIYFRFFLIF